MQIRTTHSLRRRVAHEISMVRYHRRVGKRTKAQWVRSALRRIQRTVLRVPLEFAHKRRMKNHLSKLPRLIPEDQAIVDALRDESVFVTTLDKLGFANTEKLLEICSRLKDSINIIDQVDQDGFYIHLDSGKLLENKELFLWGLNDRILDISENYLEVLVGYIGLYFTRSLRRNIKRGTRLWHMDIDDYRTFKIIIYLNDVDENCGPFQYIDKKRSLVAKKYVGYRRGYVFDDVMNACLGPDCYTSCVGPSGTVIFADTANLFHRGKVPVEDERIALFFEYNAAQPLHPNLCKQPFSRDELIEFAGSVSPRQRDSVFWR